MAYHFRKLRQTLRIIPSSKSIGFSTRVSEGDHKNPQLDGSAATTQNDENPGQRLSETHTTALACLGNSISNNVLDLTTTLKRSQSDSDLFHNLQPFLQVRTIAHPITYKDIVQVLLPRQENDSDLNDKNPVLGIVKSVGFTSDDILVNETCSPIGDKNVTVSTREQIPIDVITQNYYRRLAQEFATFTCDKPVFENNSLNDKYSQILCSGDAISDPHVCYSSTLWTNSSSKGGNNSKDGPSPEQMHDAREKLEQMVLNLFKGKHDYKMLHKHVVLENNLFGANKVSIGVSAYKLELYKLRLCIHIQLFSTSMEILSVTMMEQSGVVRIHWRLRGLPQTQNLKFWRLFQSNEAISKEDWEWIEAFSYFHIGKDGLVHKHRIDRMLPDDTRPDLTEKLRGLLNPTAKPLVN